MPLAPALQQNLDRAIAEHPPGDESRSPAAILARLVTAEHDRLCGTHEIARNCTARASCRQAADVMDLVEDLRRAYSEYDDLDEYG